MTEDVRTSPKKARRPQARSLVLRDAIAALAADFERMSVRQLFYQLVARGAIEKTDRAYKRVCDASAQMRLAGDLPYRSVVDGHRSRRLAPAWSGMRNALAALHHQYRRDAWRDQTWHVEVWCEKDALTGVIQPVADAWGVPYVATRGFPSLTLLYESAVAMAATGKPCAVLYLGDHDASGQLISANLEADLRHHGADAHVTRLALNPDQVARFRLPTRPGKATDSRQAGFVARFGDAAVELDALPPDTLTGLIDEGIRAFVDEEAWAAAEAVERLERETLASVALLDLQLGTAVRLTGDGT